MYVSQCIIRFEPGIKESPPMLRQLLNSGNDFNNRISLSLSEVATGICACKHIVCSLCEVCSRCTRFRSMEHAEAVCVYVLAGRAKQSLVCRFVKGYHKYWSDLKRVMYPGHT